jgi:hypothetical protein
MKFNQRETATVLAALRYWQREGFGSAGHERDIAEEHGKSLTKDDIDALCERINCDEDKITVDYRLLEIQKRRLATLANTESDTVLEGLIQLVTCIQRERPFSSRRER